MTDYTKPFPCGTCGKMVMTTEKHTFNDCATHKEKHKEATDDGKTIR